MTSPIESTEQLSALTFNQEGTPVITVGIELVLLCTAPLEQLSSAYASIYTRFMPRLAPHLSLWHDNKMHGMETVDAAAIHLLPNWLNDPLAQQADLFGIHLQAGTPERNPAPPSIDFFYHRLDPEHPRSGLRIIFPVNEADDAELFLANLQEAVCGLRFLYGFCGYALTWNPMFPEITRAFQAWGVAKLKRHPGLGYGDLLPFVIHAGAGVLSIGWLSLLGQEYLANLGGWDTVSHLAQDGIMAYRLGEGGVILRAGARPEIGDVNRRDRLSSYRALGRLVDPLRVSDELIDKLNLIVLQGEEKREWLLRFFLQPEERG